MVKAYSIGVYSNIIRDPIQEVKNMEKVNFTKKMFAIKVPSPMVRWMVNLISTKNLIILGNLQENRSLIME